MGRRASIALTCAIVGVTMSLAGYWNDRFPHDRRNRQRADRRAAGGGASQGARGLTNGRGSGSPSGATS